MTSQKWHQNNDDVISGGSLLQFAKHLFKWKNCRNEPSSRTALFLWITFNSMFQREYIFTSYWTNHLYLHVIFRYHTSTQKHRMVTWNINHSQWNVSSLNVYFSKSQEIMQDYRIFLGLTGCKCYQWSLVGPRDLRFRSVYKCDELVMTTLYNYCVEDSLVFVKIL